VSVESLVPLRRSPLSERHRQLRARFVATGEWPAAYGDLLRERRVLRETVGLLDLGPLDRLSLGGALSRPAGPALAVGKITEGEIDGRPVQLWGLNDDEALLVAHGIDARSSAALAASLEKDGIASTDASSLYATLVLTGPRSRDVLAELFPEDLSDRGFPDRAIVFGPLANVAVAVARQDRSGLLSYAILVERDHAEYLWDALLETGAPHGIEPVGAAALAED
jgi:aminomethyltransferase